MTIQAQPRASGLSMAYAGACYVGGVAGLGYAILFLLGVGPTSVDDAARHPWWLALGIDLALIMFWGVQHSVMARERFKKWWTKIIPAHTERSTYVLASGAALALVCLLWSPLPGSLFTVAEGPWRTALTATSLAGWALLLLATFEIDHADLFGLKQAYRAWRGLPAPKHDFKAAFLYKVVRHPIQLGVLIGVWSTPDFTASRLLFASFMTAYIVVGLHFEERALLREFPGAYADYIARVPKLIPFWPTRSSTADRRRRVAA